MASVAIESAPVALRQASKLLLALFLSQLGGFFALSLAVGDSAIAFVFLVALNRLVADLLADAFPARATRYERKRRKNEENRLSPGFHCLKLSFCTDRINPDRFAATALPSARAPFRMRRQSNTRRKGVEMFCGPL